MSDIISLQPESIEAGIIKMNEMFEKLDELAATVDSAADSLENGALLGRGGEMLADGLRNKLAKRIRDLGEKYKEMGDDMHRTLEEWLALDSSQQFGG